MVHHPLGLILQGQARGISWLGGYSASASKSPQHKTMDSWNLFSSPGDALYGAGIYYYDCIYSLRVPIFLKNVIRGTNTSWWVHFPVWIPTFSSLIRQLKFMLLTGVHLANLSIVPHVPMISQPEICCFCCAIEKGKRTRSITMPCRKTKSHPQELQTNILGNGLYSTNRVFLTRNLLWSLSRISFRADAWT